MEKKATSYDPGWNDPPLFSYDEHTAQINSSKPKKILNKRISFPMESSSPPTGNSQLPVDPTLPPRQCNLDSLPPPPMFIAICPAKVEPSENQIDEEKRTDEDSATPLSSEEALACVVVNFNSVLKSESSDIKNKNEIERRLNIMEKMWSEGKFSCDIERKILHLSEAVKEQNSKVANDLQISLMVDHASLCSPWMSGVRHLIQHGIETVEEARIS